MMMLKLSLPRRLGRLIASEAQAHLLRRRVPQIHHQSPLAPAKPHPQQTARERPLRMLIARHPRHRSLRSAPMGTLQPPAFLQTPFQDQRHPSPLSHQQLRLPRNSMHHPSSPLLQTRPNQPCSLQHQLHPHRSLFSPLQHPPRERPVLVQLLQSPLPPSSRLSLHHQATLLQPIRLS
ncbi:hypothetical protein BJY04DRAFT_194972 [Aspergillus karnatakaensis]|uniref:uncharacterized protein n=1 Tax=Aspergillus karnatakaensis TaxID=1810916 RepID=UPI003CCD9AAD